MGKMIGKLVGAAAVAAIAAGVAAPAAAQEVRGKRAGDIVVGLSVIGVLPQNAGGKTTIGGTPHASNAFTGQLDLSYFFTPSLAVNLIAATTEHDVRVNNTALGRVNLGHTWVLPPTLTFQWHLFPQAQFSPYVGLGLNASFFYGYGGSRTSVVNRVRIESAFGPALNFGFDYEISPSLAINFDVKKIFMRPDVTVRTTLGTVRGHADIDPWVVGLGIRYRF